MFHYSSSVERMWFKKDNRIFDILSYNFFDIEPCSNNLYKIIGRTSQDSTPITLIDKLTVGEARGELNNIWENIENVSVAD